MVLPALWALMAGAPPSYGLQYDAAVVVVVLVVGDPWCGGLVSHLLSSLGAHKHVKDSFLVCLMDTDTVVLDTKYPPFMGTLCADVNTRFLGGAEFQAIADEVLKELTKA